MRSATVHAAAGAGAAATVLGASLASRRWGHAAGGLMAGLPMIIGPITAILLVDQPPERVRAIALATLQSQPATLMHALVFARAARRWGWPVCLLLANGAYLGLASPLAAWALRPLAATALALVTCALAGRVIARSASAAAGPMDVPLVELWWRLGVAVGVAAAVIEGAASVPSAVGGVRLAAPFAATCCPRSRCRGTALVPPRGCWLVSCAARSASWPSSSDPCCGCRCCTHPRRLLPR